MHEIFNTLVKYHASGDDALIYPQEPHRVSLQENVPFKVEFYREKN